jgi:hypothetical protein
MIASCVVRGSFRVKIFVGILEHLKNEKISKKTNYLLLSFYHNAG